MFRLNIQCPVWSVWSFPSRLGRELHAFGQKRCTLIHLDGNFTKKKTNKLGIQRYGIVNCDFYFFLLFESSGYCHSILILLRMWSLSASTSTALNTSVKSPGFYSGQVKLGGRCKVWCGSRTGRLSSVCHGAVVNLKRSQSLAFRTWSVGEDCNAFKVGNIL